MGREQFHLSVRAQQRPTPAPPCRLPNVIQHLTFSRDGRYLAATVGSGGGLHVYRTEDFSLALSDNDYQASSYWADFDARGRIVTSEQNGLTRLYDADFQLITQRHLPEGQTRPDSNARPFPVVSSGTS